MRYRTFVTFNLVGALLWAVGVTLLGYFLGQIEAVEQNLEITILVIVGISFMPVVVELLRARAESKRDKQSLVEALLDDD